MKLKSDFLTQEIDDTLYLVPVGNEEFRGIVKNNKTAAFIINCLKEETTVEGILEVMQNHYDVPEEVLTADITNALDTLRRIGALEE